jgi:hypothetical protein
MSLIQLLEVRVKCRLKRGSLREAAPGGGKALVAAGVIETRCT